MPYKHHEPVSEEEMEKRMKNEFTLCNTLRKMYHLTNDPFVRLKCRLAFAMGKSMVRQLNKYHAIYGVNEEWEKKIEKREPIDERMMDKSRWEGHHSICQTLRDIYHATDNPEVKLNSRISMAMTKAIHDKLKEYKGIEESAKTVEMRA